MRARREELSNLTLYLQSAREEERAKIVREIHDELGQDMTALNLDLVWLSNKLPANQPELTARTDMMSESINGAIQTIRRVSSELRPGLLDDLGLTAAMEWQAGEFQKRSGIECALQLDDDLDIDGDLSTALFRIFQESLTNVARHAQASWVYITLEEKPGVLILTIRDDGRGITEQQMSDSKSMGLLGMRERAQVFDGKVALEGIPDKGTRVTVRIPRAAASTDET